LLDFAEYTSAQTRIALGKKARKVEKTKIREEMQDLIADAFVIPLLLVESWLIHLREEIDEETQEWERAQIKRSGLKPDEAFSAPAATPVYKPAPSTRLYDLRFPSVFLRRTSPPSDGDTWFGIIGHAYFSDYDFNDGFARTE
jgi:hypothetical protein